MTYLEPPNPVAAVFGEPSSLADVFEKVAIRNLRRVNRAECGWRVGSVSTVPASSRCR